MKKILTKEEKQVLIDKRAKIIVESFSNTFNKIKRVNESDLNEYGSEFGPGGEFDDAELQGQEDFYNQMNKNEKTDNDTYFETLSGALDGARKQIGRHGLELDEDDLFTSFGSGGVSYGQTKSASIRVLKNGQPIHGKSGKPLNRFFQVVIYRMETGKYELTAYKSW